jgi:DNA-binding beta-propeller fold protein YncE
MKNKTRQNPAVLMLVVILNLTFLFNVGCSSPRGELFAVLETPLVWPKPPEEPRLRYVGAISTEADLKREVSWQEGLKSAFFGKKKIGALVGPYALAVGKNNDLFVTDVAGSAVHIFNLDTRKYKQITSIGENEFLLMPVGIALVDDNVYIADSKLHSIFVFDPKGKFLFSFGHDQLERPSGITYFQQEEKIYVADTANHIVKVFSKDGAFVRQIGGRGLGEGLFNFPTHLHIGQEGKLYVSDTLNYQIQILTGDGEFLKMFGRQGDMPGNFAHPCGVATDSFGNIYISDRQFENIQIFDKDGQILMAFGQEGSEPGQFWLPGGICIDKNDRIYVADSFNKRVQIFEFMDVRNDEK